MTTSTIKKLLSPWVLFFTLFVLSDGCTILTDHTNPPIPTGLGFQLSKTTAIPLEVLTVTLDEPSDKNTLEAKLGTTLVMWQQIDSKTYGFLIPETVQPGTYSVSILNGNKTVSLMIKESVVIANPALYVEDRLKEAIAQFDRTESVEDSLVKYNLIPSNTKKRQDMKAKLNAAMSNFNSLSEKDQKLSVQFLAANRSTLDSLNQLLAEFGPLAPLKNGRRAASCPLGIRDEYARCARNKLGILALATIGSIYALKVGLETFDYPIVAAALIVYGIASTELFDLLLYNIALLTVINKQIDADVQTLRKAADSDFSNGVAKVVTYRIPLRNIQEELDKNSTDKSTRDLVGYIQTLRSLLNGRVGDFLGTKVDFAPLKQGYILPELASKLSVSVLNNPNVTAKISNFSNGLFNLTFTTNEKSDQTFTYKVSYQYDDTSVEKTITNSKLIVPNSPNNDYYYTIQFNGTIYTFTSVYAQYIGGRFDIVGDADKLQTAIFFFPAALASKGPSLNRFVYHCTTTPDKPDKYVLGSHIYNFATQRAIATTYSKGAIYGCDATQPDDNETPGQLIITQNDGSIVEGTFEYTDYISKQPVQGKFKVPIR